MEDNLQQRPFFSSILPSTLSAVFTDTTPVPGIVLYIAEPALNTMAQSLSLMVLSVQWECAQAVSAMAWESHGCRGGPGERHLPHSGMQGMETYPWSDIWAGISQGRRRMIKYQAEGTLDVKMLGDKHACALGGAEGNSKEPERGNDYRSLLY